MVNDLEHEQVSVAFRRESDEEHKEPKFELPIPPGPNLVTPRGLALIEEQVRALDAQIAAGGAEAEIEAARRDLRYWTTRQATAELVPPTTGDAVAFGTRVTFRLNGTERTVAIVGDDEADPGNGSISFSAPLARAMIDAEAGEKVDFGGKIAAIEILGIEPVD